MFTRNSDIKFVGVNDDKIDLFEGQYPVPEGISYNSYYRNTAAKTNTSLTAEK